MPTFLAELKPSSCVGLTAIPETKVLLLSRLYSLECTTSLSRRLPFTNKRPVVVAVFSDKWYRIWYHRWRAWEQPVIVGKKDRLYDKVSNAPATTRFEDVVALARLAGFEEKRSRNKKSGSHTVIMQHPLHPELLINLQPDHGMGKRYQVRQLIGLIDEHDLLGA
jgi:hypothetical protein